MRFWFLIHFWISLRISFWYLPKVIRSGMIRREWLRRRSMMFSSSLVTTNYKSSETSERKSVRKELETITSSNIPQVQVSPIPSVGCHTLWPPFIVTTMIRHGCLIPFLFWRTERYWINNSKERSPSWNKLKGWWTMWTWIPNNWKSFWRRVRTSSLPLFRSFRSFQTQSPN